MGLVVVTIIRMIMRLLKKKNIAITTIITMMGHVAIMTIQKIKENRN
jgi:hypothetical protein